jgi:UDP-N-acetylglucosamine--dolichyl-phosphate N-acetylglucosaminephosphotransferase
MYIYWRVRKYPVAKFGRPRADRTLEVPNALTLKWVLPYYMKVTERQGSFAMFLVTGCFV